MPVPRQEIFRLLLLMALAWQVSTPVFSQSVVPTDTQKTLLERAFTRAFSAGTEFRATGLFDRLGYSPEQVKAIVEVTPRPATLSVSVEPDPIIPGKYRSLRIHALGVHYYNLLIQEATLDFSSSEIDIPALEEGRLSFRAIPQVGIETRVAATDILKVFGFFASARKLSDLKLSITSKATTLTGKLRRGLFTAQFKVTGAATVEKPRRINFNCRRMIINGLSLPRAAIRTMFNHVNPVFDSSRTWLNLELDEVVNEDGKVFSTGRLLGPASGASVILEGHSASGTPVANIASFSSVPRPLPLPLPLQGQ